MIELRIDGKPTGKGRPRFDPRTRRTYTPAGTVSAEQRVQATWLAAGRPRIDGPITFEVELVVERPKTHWRRDGTLSAAGHRTPWPIRKPDFDNCLKLLADALNGCAYRDDVDVVHSWFVRRWARPDEFEHTIVRIRPMPAMETAA